jgi:hypothetical protein
VFGPKTDRWLVRTVAGLLLTSGAAQLSAHGAPGLAVARRVGTGTAATLLAIDLVYVPKGRIRPTYLLDAACEVGWLVAWLTASRQAREQGASREPGAAPEHGASPQP